MSQSMSKILVLVVAAIAITGGVSHRAIGQAQSQDVIVTLGDNDGIFVEKATFKAVEGNGAKGDPTATLAKLGAKEVSAGAIIYRSGDKLYIVDGTPPDNASPQFMTELHDWCPTCTWYQQNKGSYMK